MRWRSGAACLGVACVALACAALACAPHASRAPAPAEPPGLPAARAEAPVASAAPGDRAELTATEAAPIVATPTRRPGAYANLDPSDDYVVGPPEPYADCEAELTRAGVRFRVASLPVHVPRKSKIACGAPQVVTYLRGPGDIAYNAAPMVTCSMALALASWERIVQREATAIFGSPVARIDQLGTYNCREMAAYPGWISEHSYANAIDIGRFVLKNGKSVEVLRDFEVSTSPPAKPAGTFLRAVSRRANDEDVFSHVLTPFFDAHHKNHFNLDLARYRSDGTRPPPDESPPP